MRRIRVLLALCALVVAAPVLAVGAAIEGALARMRGETAEERAWRYGA